MIPHKAANIVSREEETGFLLYNPLTDELHTVSHLGMTILDACDGTNSVDDILAILASSNPLFLDADARVLIMDFLKEIADRKILNINDTSQTVSNVSQSTT